MNIRICLLTFDCVHVEFIMSWSFSCCIGRVGAGFTLMANCHSECFLNDLVYSMSLMKCKRWEFKSVIHGWFENHCLHINVNSMSAKIQNKTLYLLSDQYALCMLMSLLSVRWSWFQPISWLVTLNRVSWRTILEEVWTTTTTTGSTRDWSLFYL